MLSVNMLSVNMLSAIMMSAIMLSANMLIVAAPFSMTFPTSRLGRRDPHPPPLRPPTDLGHAPHHGTSQNWSFWARKADDDDDQFPFGERCRLAEWTPVKRKMENVGLPTRVQKAEGEGVLKDTFFVGKLERSSLQI